MSATSVKSSHRSRLDFTGLASTKVKIGPHTKSTTATSAKIDPMPNISRQGDGYQIKKTKIAAKDTTKALTKKCPNAHRSAKRMRPVFIKTSPFVSIRLARTHHNPDLETRESAEASKDHRAREAKAR
ncbi:hypothetical protein [Hydrogenophaga sp.]|uniref:hypothetical protein n=1 Tax=Hydrogenophaga sp. TaxID=1904254 RepID=UPI0025C4E127|nr:hypothetical protein [Hydrogenophaga sp.]